MEDTYGLAEATADTDWIKTLSWDLPDDLPGLLWALRVKNADVATQAKALEKLTTLPAWQAAPSNLKIQVQGIVALHTPQQRYSADQPRDADGRFGSGGGGSNPTSALKLPSAADLAAAHEEVTPTQIGWLNTVRGTVGLGPVAGDTGVAYFSGFVDVKEGALKASAVEAVTAQAGEKLNDLVDKQPLSGASSRWVNVQGLSATPLAPDGNKAKTIGESLNSRNYVIQSVSGTVTLVGGKYPNQSENDDDVNRPYTGDLGVKFCTGRFTRR